MPKRQAVSRGDFSQQRERRMRRLRRAHYQIGLLIKMFLVVPVREKVGMLMFSLKMMEGILQLFLFLLF